MRSTNYAITHDTVSRKAVAVPAARIDEFTAKLYKRYILDRADDYDPTDCTPEELALYTEGDASWDEFLCDLVVTPCYSNATRPTIRPA